MDTKKRELHEKVKRENNSSMAQNLEEIKKLGKEMEEEKTGPELKKEEKQTPDPQQ
ncbi:hypothetical protein [Bacillus sp. UNC41MFS5]|uniref:hypothetical protein n=1 Tax=Bacillus sp. UNC41MFS5 TaxID=1449046 RepID=UPI000A6652CC|nr:hypothetical protein [Bacillus sp. UNC41MFS5]